MKKLRCLAIDDEPFALQILADDISKVPFLELTGQFSSPLKAYNQLQSGHIDLLFLDIQMPTINGVQFLRTLGQPPMVIFTTAYEQYALESYELGVIDYLLKPIPIERFLKAVNKAYERIQWQQTFTNQPSKLSLRPVNDIPSVKQAYFFIFVEYREIKIFYDDVLYIEGLKDYVKIYTTQQALPYISRLTMKDIGDKLPSDLFCRVHKSFIVAFSKINSFQRTNLTIAKQKIPIGSTYADAFKRQYRAITD